MLSCFSGDTHVTKVLLGHGADANLQNEDGITALMMSSYNGHTEIVELLLEYGADLCVMTSIGMTALRVSTDNGHKEVTKLLIEHGANRRVTSSLPVCRKRTVSARDSTFISTRVVTQDSDTSRQESKIDQILQLLLQNQDIHLTTTSSSRHDHAATASSSRQDPAITISTSSDSEECAIGLHERPTLHNAHVAIRDIAYDWKDIGRHLKLTNHSLKEIYHDSDGTANNCLLLMLKKWLKRAIPPPTWEELAEAVENTDQTIARKIRRTS